MKIAIFILLIFIGPFRTQGQSFVGESGKIAFDFYQKVMSPVKDHASKCQFYPSCSEYSKIAINKYGFAKGLAMTTDRLMRCSGGHSNDGRYPNGPNNLLLDPPENNSLFAEGGLWTSSSDFSSYTQGIQVTAKDSTFAFAKNLVLENDYTSAILELKRIKFNTSNDIVRNKVSLLISSVFLISDRVNEAYAELMKISDTSVNQELFFIENYMVWDKKDLQSRNIKLCKDYLSTPIYDLSVRCLLFSNFKYDYLQSFRSDSIYSSHYLKYDDALQSAKKSISQINYKSPTIAGIMSAILPGSGYVYAGSLKEGLSAFFVNGLLGAGIYSLFANDNVGSGILLSAFSASFYFGNIIGSSNSAIQSNQIKEEEVFRQLRSDLNLDMFYSKDYYISAFDK